MPRSDWSVELLTTWEAIEDPGLVALWKDIAERANNAHVFFHPVLVRVWLDTYRPLRDLRPLFVHAWRGEQQVLFPLVLWRRNWKNAWLRVVVPAGHSDFDYHDPLFLLPPVPGDVATFYEALQNTLDEKVDYDRLLIDGLHEDYLPPNARVTRSDACLSWPLSEVTPVDGLVLPAKKRLAQDTRRRYRRLKELSEVHFRRFTASDADNAQQSLAMMLQMHAKRWPNAYKAPGFHQRLVAQGLVAGLVDFSEVRLDRRPIAWRISFIFKGRYSDYMPAIDSDFLKYGPGHVSLGFALAEALSAGMTTVDHLRGGEDYKSAWGGEETLVHDIVLNRDLLISRLRTITYEALCRLKKAHRRTQS